MNDNEWAIDKENERRKKEGKDEERERKEFLNIQQEPNCCG